MEAHAVQRTAQKAEGSVIAEAIFLASLVAVWTILWIVLAKGV